MNNCFISLDLCCYCRGGKVIYDGTSVGIVEYLESLGYNNPEGHNIADYILDLISRGMNEDKMQLKEE